MIVGQSEAGVDGRDDVLSGPELSERVGKNGSDGWREGRRDRKMSVPNRRGKKKEPTLLDRLFEKKDRRVVES